MTSSSPVVSDMFGSRSPLAEEYAKLLCTDGIERGLIGPREADRIWNRHILNSALLCDIQRLQILAPGQDYPASLLLLLGRT